MDTPTFNPSDVVKFAAAKDAANISTAFDQLVGQRVVDAIEARKKEVAMRMFNQGVEQDDEEAGQTVDTEDSTAEHEGEVGDEEQSTETEESDETAEQNS